MLQMDQNNIKARGIPNNVRYLCSPDQQDPLGKSKSLSDCCGAYSGVNAGLEKHGHDSDHEINSCEAENLPAMERKSLSYDNISSIDSTKENADYFRPLSSVVSTSRNSVLEKESCAEGTSRVRSHCNRQAGDEYQEDGDMSAHSFKGVDSIQNICMKSDVSLETGEPLNKENTELLNGRMNGYCLNADEDKLKSMMQETYHDKQFKTESSSSNSTNIIFPASSYESCQKTSVDPKSCNHNKTSDMDTSNCTDLQFSLKEPVVKSLVVGMATQIAARDVLDMMVFLPGKQGNVSKASEIVDNVRARDGGRMSGILADRNSVTMEMSDLPNTKLPKNKNAELPNRDKEERCYEVDDALEVAWRVAREVEQEVGTCRDASGSFTSIEERSGGTVHLSSVDSIDPNERDGLTENGHRIQLCSEQNKCDSFSSSKEVVDPEMSVRNIPLCLKVEDSSKDMGPTMVHVANDGLNRQELSYLTMKPKDVIANDQTTQLSRIDLNVDILVNEADCPKQLVRENLCFLAENLSKPIPVLAKLGIPICFPMPQLQFEGEGGGWRGSAATSAFRPTSHTESFNRNNASSANDNNDSKHSQVKGIDLNIAAAGADFNMELLHEKCAPEFSNLPSEESSVEVRSTRAKRFNIDLNSVSENDDNCHQPSPPASLSGHSVRDFDLNDHPISMDAYSDAQQQGQGILALRHRAIDDPAVSFLGNAKQPNSSSVGSAYWADLSPVQGLSHGHGESFLLAAPNVLSPVEQMQRVVSLQHKSTYSPLPPIPPPPPPHAFTYNNGFFIDPNNCLTSAVYTPGVIPYMTDSRGATVFPQILGSAVLPAFSGAPHFMQVPRGPGSSEFAIIRPGFDLNGGLTYSENGSREENGRQWFIPVRNSAMDEQMKSLQQVASSATPMKRRQPEGGWDSHQLGYRQVTSWH